MAEVVVLMWYWCLVRLEGFWEDLEFWLVDLRAFEILIWLLGSILQ